MSKERKSFLLHFDSLGILDHLTNDQCGKLFIACRDYNLGKELKLDETLALVFFPFKAQFLRDKEKYNSVVNRNKTNGSKGGRPVNPVKPKKPTGLIDNPSKPKKADSGSVSVSVSDSDSGNESDNDNNSVKEVNNARFAEFWDLYGKKVDRPKCENKFSKLTSTEIVLLFTNLPLYIKSKPEKQYRKDPIRWLNGKCWNDEIILQTNQAKSTHTFETQNYTSGKF